MVFELSNILTIVLLILIILPLLIYLVYNREAQVKYSNKTYSEPPSNDPPALINSFFCRGIDNPSAGINIKSFYITLLDLINRKYISVKIVSKNIVDGKEKKSQSNGDLEYKKTLDKIILKVNTQSIDKLALFEKNVLNVLNSLEDKGNIDLLNTKDVQTKRLKVSKFQKNYDNWMANLYNEYFKTNKEKLFNHKFNQILKVYGVFLIVVSILIAIFSYFEAVYLNLILAIIMGILGIILLIIPFRISGWSKVGKKQKAQWDSFKNYYVDGLKSSNISPEFLDEGIKFLPYLIALGISKDSLLENFSVASELTDTYFFLKYVNYSLVANIVKDFLAADGSFDPKYYNTSGNFVPGYGL